MGGLAAHEQGELDLWGDGWCMHWPCPCAFSPCTEANGVRCCTECEFLAACRAHGGQCWRLRKEGE